MSSTKAQRDAMQKINQLLQAAIAASDDDDGATEFTHSLERIQLAVNLSHLLIKRVVDVYEDGGDISRLIPGLHAHIEACDRYCGAATSKAAKRCMDSLDKVMEEED